ncbi:hypothetical protein DVH24_021102 [Malus domestica]|uniref:Plant heme peroxidase family profile domain-containing protein n=1 Tax=Malus domestica TaxID=3750 RepID=A0A498J8G4_MALDO|nr:hypothetical protein DVH24_021102 [Malus domestica]
MIAVAGAEAVSICGGPTIQVPLGRLDAKERDPERSHLVRWQVPTPMSGRELDPEGKLPEETLDAFGLKQSFQTKGLSTQELVALSGAHTIGNKGFGNPTVFDNTYFKILLDKTIFRRGIKGFVTLDHKVCRGPDTFFNDFKTAYLKLVNSGARWKSL